MSVCKRLCVFQRATEIENCLGYSAVSCYTYLGAHLFQTLPGWET